ncbi:MAG: GNAT family N-acetyltransferase [Acidimicrobiia bacterium]|nr:GNAT family N-acetyltransferase [Acidimicrobiia bacterium]
MLEVVEVAAANSTFSEVANRIYAKSPVWAPGSAEAASWAFSEAAAERLEMHAVVAVADGVPAARAAAIAPPGDIGWIGLFECASDRPGSGPAVLEACESYLTRRGYTSVEGPRSDPLTAGLQIGGFDLPQTLFTTHNPPHYLDLFLDAGYRVATQMVAPIMTRERAPALAFEVPDVDVRQVDLNSLTRELASFHRLQGAVFSARPGYVPRSPADTGRLVNRLLPYLDEELVVVAESAGEVVGSLICLPDGWQSADRSRIDRARILSIGVLPGWERRGLGIAMGSFLMEALLRKGYQSVEGVWVLEYNTAPRELAERFGAITGRRFAMMQKRL